MIILQANCNHPRWQIRTQIAEASSWLPWKHGTRPSQPSGRHAYNSCFRMDVSHGLMTDMRKHKKTKKHQREEYPQPPQIAIVCIIGQMMRVGQPNTGECTKGCDSGNQSCPTPTRYDVWLSIIIVTKFQHLLAHGVF